MRFAAFTIIALLAASARIAAAAPATQPAGGLAGGFDVREWAVFVIDASQNKLNPEGVVDSTLPPFVSTRRDSSPSHDASPVGIIRLIGTSDKSVDVSIEQSSGDFLASWPLADRRSKQLLWKNMTLAAASPTGHGVEAVPDGHWFESLRGVESAYLSTEGKPSERFLLYDLEMSYPSPLNVVVSKDHSFAVSNAGHATLHHLAFYQQTAGSWAQGNVGDLAATAVAPAPAPATRAATVPAAVFMDAPAASLPSTSPAPSSATHPSTQPAPGIAVTMTPATRPSDLADPWKPVLQNLGVSDADAGVMVSILAATIKDSHKLAAVYVMDEAEFDRLLPLEVVPEPRTIRRIGLVIVKNADPNAGSDIDDLIVQLGDPAWPKRDEAYKALAKIGSAAVPKLRTAAKSKDIEVVWRAEKLLADVNKKKP